MSTTQKAIAQVEARGFPYWKLYKGNNRIAQCDRDENKGADSELALQLFIQELEYQSDEPGEYRVNVYKNLNGEKGGFNYKFNIFQTESPVNLTRNRSEQSPLNETLYERIKRDVEMDMRLKRIEEKLDGIISLIAAKTTDDKEDDDKALDFIKSLAMGAIAKKAAIPKAGGFSNL